MLISTAILIIIYGIIILLGYYDIFPMDLDDPDHYIFAAKNIIYIGIFILSLSIFKIYKELDIFAILMSIVIIVLFIFKISRKISK